VASYAQSEPEEQRSMKAKHRPSMLHLPAAAQAALVAGARALEPVSGLTHGFYKYPARFSPSFVRAAIETFTQPADLVLDATLDLTAAAAARSSDVVASDDAVFLNDLLNLPQPPELRPIYEQSRGSSLMWGCMSR